MLGDKYHPLKGKAGAIEALSFPTCVRILYGWVDSSCIAWA